MFYHAAMGESAMARNRQICRLRREGLLTLGGNHRLKIYGWLSCRSGKRMLATNRVFFSGEAEAEAHGYRPCGHCMPEAYRRWKTQQG
ncbi:Ada metal-binding domain-containing protein [Chitinophaga varians]|uniref:Ada metal-binding domain-containing protein n=1 Tax=Chitinophaga varians TaxID=2202339 RepID=UPI00165F6588|nr:Ada metal-binding domain-containing protein [Chitinophaga varians]MBC9911899.1 metal-binding protein [Chitinophaga varians]